MADGWDRISRGIAGLGEVIDPYRNIDFGATLANIFRRKRQEQVTAPDNVPQLNLPVNEEQSLKTKFSPDNPIWKMIDSSGVWQHKITPEILTAGQEWETKKQQQDLANQLSQLDLKNRQLTYDINKKKLEPEPYDPAQYITVDQTILSRIPAGYRQLYQVGQPVKRSEIIDLISSANKLASDTSTKGDTRLKAYNDAYSNYLRMNGGRYDSNSGEWVFPTGFQPLNQVDFIRQSFPNGEAAARQYIQLVTGMNIPEQTNIGNTSKAKGPSYRPNNDYNVNEWQTVRDAANRQYGGPGKALIVKMQSGNATPKELLILLDSYNQNNGTHYTLQEFRDKFIKRSINK